jgi:hypothetical protein
MMLGRGDLNSEFAKGLEAAFEQADCMFRANADLAIKNHENYIRQIDGELTLDTW